MLKTFFNKYGFLLILQTLTILFFMWWLKPVAVGNIATVTDAPKAEIRLQEQVLYDSIASLNSQLTEQQKLTDGLQLILRDSKIKITYFQNKLYDVQQKKSPVIPQLAKYNADSILQYWAKEFR